MVFQRADAGTHGGLGQVEAFRGADEAAGGHYGQESARPFGIHEAN